VEVTTLNNPFTNHACVLFPDKGRAAACGTLPTFPVEMLNDWIRQYRSVSFDRGSVES